MPRLVVFLLGLAAVAGPAAVPAQDKKQPKKDPPGKVLYAVPLVARPGEKQKFALRGKGLDAVKEVKVAGADGATAKVLGAKKVPVPNNYPGDRVGDSEVEIELELPKGVKPGDVTLTAGDAAPYKLLLRDGLAAVAEKEPNDGFDAAQVIPVPCAVEGTIKAERDADVFRFEGKKGNRVRIEVQAARFGSPVDALVTVFDPGRRLLAAADDVRGSPDPVLTLTLPRDGAYFVTLIDANDLGGANFGYRLVVKPAK